MNTNKDLKPTILDRIVAKKKLEVAAARSRTPVSVLEESDLFQRECYSMRDFMLDADRTGIIAEYKRKSPSKGIINDRHTVKQVTQAYAGSGASVLSVLTDRSFFGGRKRDVTDARKFNSIPILRKDFMLEEYQIIESKAIGADVVLLIASILSPAEIKNLAVLGRQIGMGVLLEVHSAEELERSLCDELSAVGVNNRNLADFSVSLEHSFKLAELIPDSFMKVSESGISSPDTVRDLRAAGYNGFLIGENFMKAADPAQAFREFVAGL